MGVVLLSEVNHNWQAESNTKLGPLILLKLMRVIERTRNSTNLKRLAWEC